MIDYTQIVRNELGGVYGNEVLKEMNEIINLYNFYDGEGQDWYVNDTEYIHSKTKTNYAKKLIKEEARFFFGKTPTFEIQVEGNDDLQQQLNKFLADTLESNLFSEKLIKGARDCFIGKRVAIKLHADTITKTIKAMFVPSLEFVYEPFEDRVDELQKIIFFHAMNDRQEKKDQIIWKQKYEMVNGRCLLTEGFYNGYGELLELLHNQTDLNLSGIPCYVILNDGLSGDFKGESDVAELIDNAIAYSKMNSEDEDTLKKGMNRTIYAMDIADTDNLKLGPGSFWDLQTDPTSDGAKGQVGTLPTDFNYNERVENFLARKLSDMYNILNIPQVTPQELQGFATSGKSLKALYWQLITRCEEKFMAWKPALIWLVKAMLEMKTVYLDENTNIQFLEDVKVTVKNKYPLQEDEDAEKALDMQEVNNQLLSKKAYLMKWKGFTEEQADEMLLEILKEQRILEESYEVE